MRNKSISFLTFLTFVSCASNKNIDISNIQGLSILRKEQKIESLKNQIAFARNVRNSAQKNLENLKEELYNQEFSLIQKKLNKFKKFDAKLQKDKEAYNSFLANDLSILFIEERKMLIEMIEESDQIAEKAKNLMNDILSLITILNDKKSA